MTGVLEELVRRVTALERQARRGAAESGGFPNARVAGAASAQSAATWSTTSGAYVDLGGTDVTRRTVRKMIAGSELWVVFGVEAYATDGDFFIAETGVQVDGGADYGAWRTGFSLLNAHAFYGGMIAIPGLAAGDRTIELRVRRQSGTATYRIDGNDAWYWLAFEVPSAITGP